MASESAFFARIAPAIGLFALSPLVGEFLFGNVSIDALYLAFVLMPMYGGGVLLVREAARHTGRGWPTIFLLGLAYGVVEEGVATQLLFNPSYSGYGVFLTGPTYLPAFGINVIITLSVLTLHAVWSICVPIALVEAMVPQRSEAPWLKVPGLAITGIFFVGGVVLVRQGDAQSENFNSTTLQFVGSLVAAAAIALIAFPSSREGNGRAVGRAPHPWMVGGVSLIGTLLLMVFNIWTLGRELTQRGALSGWVTVVAWLVVVITLAILIRRWSQLEGWTARHKLALAAGAALTYAGVAFPQVPVVGSTGIIDFIGNLVFACATLLLLALAARRIRRYERVSNIEPIAASQG